MIDTLTSMNYAYGRGRLKSMGIDEQTDLAMTERMDITAAGYKDQWRAGVRDQVRQDEDHDRRLNDRHQN